MISVIFFMPPQQAGSFFCQENFTQYRQNTYIYLLPGMPESQWEWPFDGMLNLNCYTNDKTIFLPVGPWNGMLKQ
jgi:hypothetical protein